MTAAITIDDRQALHDLREFAEVGDSVGVLNILAAHRIQARKEAIEEAAGVADSISSCGEMSDFADGFDSAAGEIAAAIRALTTDGEARGN